MPVPERLSRGIAFDHVSFTYPGTGRRVLEDVCLDLEPGSVVALVGENGAGKSTLVKLLCRLYQPTEGRIFVDGFELARMPADAWRSRLAGAFQDFFRFEFRARHSVGVGDLSRIDDGPAVVAAVERAGAADVVSRLAQGSRRSSARPGPTASRSASASGRSSPWPAASCAITRSCLCSTSPPRRSTPKPSTPCSNDMPRPRGR